ncbi:MAG TPA: hypothetical protein VFN23_20760 [Ktedonobacteraceae bacterium]|nr:hypothetical protein [Ktedonobacteraceae bacterium]
MFATNRKKPVYAYGKRRRLPLMLIGISVTVLIALIGVGLFVIRPLMSSHAAAAVNQTCTLTIPANPLTAQGLATPYQLSATDPAAGPCNEGNANQAAFVQAVILDPATGKMSAYEPLVVDQGTQPAVAPIVPQLPANAVVGIWFGDNGNALTLQNHAKAAAQGNANATANTKPANIELRGGNLRANCVNGAAGSVFGQFGYCNAPAFFQAANQAIAAGLITVPPLGTANDGMACPSTRDFSIVDMDQSDNVQTQYLVDANGQTAQVNAANQAKLPNATTQGNPSDNALVSKIVDPALGCQSYQIPDLANPGTMTATLATDELQAAADQQAPSALVPALDEMVLSNGQPNLTKLNAYRVGVDQPRAATLNDANTTTYCQNIVNIALPRLNKDMATFQNVASPDKGVANTLFGFLANRLSATLDAGGLNCLNSLNIQNPVTLTTDGNGVVTAATIATTTTPANTGNGNGGVQPGVTPTTPAGQPSATPTTPAGQPNATPTTPAAGVTPTPAGQPDATPTTPAVTPTPMP